jgi:hypothetical protein
MTTSNKSWRKSEGGVLGRFGDPRRALKAAGLVVGDTPINPEQSSFRVDRGVSLRDLKLRLIPRIDHEQLARLSAESRESLGVALVLREPSLKRFTLLNQWALEDLPETITLDQGKVYDRVVWEKTTISLGLIAIAPSAELEFGITIARKEFHLNTEGEGNQFPHRFVDGSLFAQEYDLPESTCWYVQIKDESGELDAAATFEVLINKEMAQYSRVKGADLMWAQVGADTYSALFLALLNRQLIGDPPKGSLLEAMQRTLEDAGQSLSHVSTWVREREFSKVHSLAQSLAKMNILMKELA